MSDWKILSKCQTCHKKRLYIAKREISLPQINKTATSKKLMCGNCISAINKALNQNKP